MAKRKECTVSKRGIAALSKLPVSRSVQERSLTLEEGLEVIRAYRRGVSVADIAKELGYSHTGFYTVLGTWALRNAALLEDSGKR